MGIWPIIAAAWAQEAPPPAPLPTELPVDVPPFDPGAATPVPSAPPMPPPPVAPRPLPELRVGQRWVGRGPPGVVDLSDVAVRPDVPGTWAMASLDGSVWVTTDAGRQWSSVLGAFLVASQQEEILREIDARVGEITSDLDPTDLFSGVGDENDLQDQLQDFADDAAQASSQAADELQADLDAGAWFLEQQALQRGEFDHARPRVWFARDGRLLIGRADGLRVATPSSGTWELQQVRTDPVSALQELPDSSFLVGAPDGLSRCSADFSSSTSLSAFVGERVLDLVLDGGLYASTASGVRWTGEGVFWQTLAVSEGLVYTARTVTADPVGLSVPLVIAGEATLGRTLKTGTDPVGSVVGGPMPRTLAIARRRDDLLIAASQTGPWLSVDTGQSWVPFGLGEPGVSDVRDVEIVDELVLLASTGGLWVLEPVPPVEVPAELTLPEWVSVAALAQVATGRPELTAHVAKRWQAALLPTLTSEFTFNQVVRDSWDADTWTLRSVDSWWQVRLVGTWYPGRLRSTSSYDVLDPESNLAVLVTNEDVLIDDGTSTQILGSAVRRGATEYKSELIDQIGRLWNERQRIVAEGLRPGAPLLEQVRQSLRVAEIEARLDALTDGAVSEYSSGGGG